MSAARSRSVAALPAPLRRCPPLPSAGGRAGPGAAASRCGSRGADPVRPRRELRCALSAVGSRDGTELANSVHTWRGEHLIIVLKSAE